jgi:hypothetical protein
VGSRRGLLGIRHPVRKRGFDQRLCRIVRLCVEWPHRVGLLWHASSVLLLGGVGVLIKGRLYVG